MSLTGPLSGTGSKPRGEEVHEAPAQPSKTKTGPPGGKLCWTGSVCSCVQPVRPDVLTSEHVPPPPSPTGVVA